MKIVLELDEDEAEAFNELISQGYRTQDNCSHVSRDHDIAYSEWKKGYEKGRQND